LFAKRNPPVGAAPGTLAIASDQLAPKIYAFSYSASGFEESELTDLDQLSNDADRVNWIDVQGLGDEATLWRIAQAFGIHPLALEDAVNTPQRAKAEPYEEHLLIIGRTPVRDEAGKLDLPQVSIFVGPGYVVTFQDRKRGLFEPVRARIRAGKGPIWSMKSDYLAYALLDTMIDRYYPIVEDLVERIDDLEDEVIHDPTRGMLPELYQIRRELVLLRRVGVPQRSAIHELSRTTPFISSEVRTYLRDTHDHISQLTELVESSRDLTLAVMDMYLSAIGNKTNDIMKVLTLLSSIFIPMTFIAGVYGMNFEFMPEIHRPWAYPVVIGVMVLIAASMLWLFIRRGWIGQPSRRRHKSRAQERDRQRARSAPPNTGRRES